MTWVPSGTPLLPPPGPTPAVADCTPRRRRWGAEIVLVVTLLCTLCPLGVRGQLRGSSDDSHGPQLPQEDLDIASFLGIDLGSGENADAFASFLGSSSSTSTSNHDASVKNIDSFPGKSSATSGDDGAETLASLLGLASLDSSGSTDIDPQSPDKSSFFGHGTGGSDGGTDSKPKTALDHGPAPPESDPLYISRAKTIREAAGRDPVIVLNGLGGAGLQFRLRGAKPSYSYCRTWYLRFHTAWILPRVVIPPVARCLMDFITPIYDSVTQTFSNKPGVAVKVTDFGQIISLENLGPSILPLRNFDYIRGFVKFMVSELGYGPGLDLFAAPYDWRYTPDVLKEQVSRSSHIHLLLHFLKPVTQILTCLLPPSLLLSLPPPSTPRGTSETCKPSSKPHTSPQAIAACT